MACRLIDLGQIALVFSDKCISNVELGSAVCATAQSSNQTLPRSPAASIAASTQTVTVNCSSCPFTSPEILLDVAGNVSLQAPWRAEGEAAAAREQLGVLQQMLLIHSLLIRNVFVSEHHSGL